MDDVEVLVVGGGPAGSSCAWRLQQLGISSMVLDKAVFPRDKVCAGWVTPQVIQALSLDPQDYAKKHVMQNINAFRTGFIGEATIHTPYEKTVSYGIRRSEFDHYLLQRSGAKLCLGEAIKSLEHDGQNWLVNGHIRARMLVGAGGHFCPVARHLGAHPGRSEKAVLAKEAELDLSDKSALIKHIDPQTPHLYFCKDLKGYGWIFRKGDYINVGLGREISGSENQGLSNEMKSFCTWLETEKIVPAGILRHFPGHAYLLYKRVIRKWVDKAVVLIGDAAGLAHPQSGEGILPAIQSGIVAAELIADSEGDYSRKSLSGYEAHLYQLLGKPKTGISEKLPELVRQPLSQLLMSRPWFIRKIVLDSWFLHR